MRGLSGWLRFKDTPVDKPPTGRGKRGEGRGERHGSRAEEEEGGLINGRSRKFIADKIDRFVI